MSGSSGEDAERVSDELTPARADAIGGHSDLASGEDDRRLAELHRGIARRTAIEARQELRHMEARAARFEQEAKLLDARLRKVRLLPEVRVAARARRAIRRVRRAVKAASSTTSPQRAPGSPAAERRIVEAERARPATGTPLTGPLVSIVMLNRDGEGLLRRCLPAIARTAYRDVQLVFVDNASSDASLSVLEDAGLPFEVQVIRNSTNLSFSEANNAALEQCRGDLVLFLNNDIEPIEPGWLGRLVETASSTAAAAVGTRLIYPATPLGGGNWTSAPLSLQHAGVTFRLVDGAPLPVPEGAGGDPLDARATSVRDVFALTAACLLVRRDALEAVGGFPGGYEYGLEDVDLCLSLVAAGERLVYDGRVALWHHESATRGADPSDVRRTRVEANRSRFLSRWGPRLFRSLMLDGLEGGQAWRRAPISVRVLGASADHGSDPLTVAAELGWEVASSSGTPVDLEIVCDPSSTLADLSAQPIRVAWLTGDATAWARCPWLPDADVHVAADPAFKPAVVERAIGRTPVVLPRGIGRAQALASALRAWVEAAHLAILIEAPDWENARLGGDLPFARDLQRALERAGRRTRVRLLPEWEIGAAARDDATLQLLGRRYGPTRSGQVNALWHISHPDAGDIEEYRRYDLVFAASEPFARFMAAESGRPVLAMMQATDPERFKPGGTGPSHELLFVANSRRTRRHLIDDLLPTDRQLAVYGARWDREGLDARYLAGAHVDNDELAGYYASAAIVLNDHWLDMRREAFLSNRLFDASAAGAFVITDDIETLDETFDGGIVAYRDRDDLARLIDHYLAAPADRGEHVMRARAAVLARHTFAHRAATILGALAPFETDRPSAIPATSGAAPDASPVRPAAIAR